MSALHPVDTTASYDQLFQAVIRNPETSYSLRMRVMEDDKNDPVSAISDAMTLLNLAVIRLRELPSARKDFFEHKHSA